MIDHVENEQEDQMGPLLQLKKVLLHQEEEENHQYCLTNLSLMLDLEDWMYPVVLDLSLWQYRHVENTNGVTSYWNYQ